MADGLLSLVRTVGVLVGLWGSYVTAPDAWRELVSSALRALKDQWHEDVARLHVVRHRVSLFVNRLLRRPAATTTHPIGIPDSVSISDQVTITVTEEANVWSEQVEGQIEILRARTERLKDDLRTLRSQQARGIDELRAALSASDVERTAALDALRQEQRRKEAALLAINVRGLPLIGLSLLLSGLPDAMLRWAPASLALLVITGVLVLVVGLGRPGAP